MANRGRPPSFNQSIADEICARIAGGESLRRICADDHLPSTETVRKWLTSPDRVDFLAQYARAREEQADHYADEIIELADNAEDPAKARLQVDARKWVASKLKPKVYGDKLDLSGGLTVKKVSAEPITDEQWASEVSSS